MNKARTGIFWDYETCPISGRLKGSTIVDKIGHIATIHGRVTAFKMYLRDRPINQPSDLFSELAVCGVLIERAVDPDSSPFVQLLSDVLIFAIDNTSPATIVLISKNALYTYPLSLLHRRGFSLVLITSRGDRLARGLRFQAASIHEWNTEILDVEPNQGPNGSQQSDIQTYFLQTHFLTRALDELVAEDSGPQPNDNPSLSLADPDFPTLLSDTVDQRMLGSAGYLAHALRSVAKVHLPQLDGSSNSIAYEPDLGTGQSKQAESSSSEKQHAGNQMGRNRPGSEGATTVPGGRESRSVPSNSEIDLNNPQQTFQPLTNALQALQNEGNYQPLRSVVGSRLPKNIYAQFGATSFSQYVTLAEDMGIVQLGGQGRKSWIVLRLGAHHAAGRTP